MFWKSFRRAIGIPALLAVILGGCATHSWVPGPNARGTFDEARGNCSLMAKSGASGFYASGSPRFVAGAALAHGIGEAIRTQASFNDCMQASGWVTADGQSQVSSAVNALSACSAAAYNEPTYADLKPLAPANANSATTEQMTNGNRASDSEIRLLNERRARILPCRQQALEQLRMASPVMAAAAMEVYSKSDQSFSDLIDRKISWGEYVTRNKMATEIAQARVASNTMAPVPTEVITTPVRSDPVPSASGKTAQATKPAAVAASAVNNSYVVPSPELRTDAASVPSQPPVRAMGWEATVSRLGGGARQ